MGRSGQPRHVHLRCQLPCRWRAQRLGAHCRYRLVRASVDITLLLYWMTAALCSIPTLQCRRPCLTDGELTRARDTVRFDMDDAQNRPEVEPIMTDWLHAAAFRENTLGLPRFCHKPDAVTRDHLLSFMSAHFAPSRTCVVGKDALAFASSYFRRPVLNLLYLRVCIQVWASSTRRCAARPNSCSSMRRPCGPDRSSTKYRPLTVV